MQPGKNKKALVVGCSGQDGSYLCELLLQKGYKVHGAIRRSSTPNLGNIEHIKDDIELHWADLGDSGGLSKLLHSVSPNEVYNLAAMSDVGISFKTPEYTTDVTGTGAVRLLQAIPPGVRYYQASSSEMFGSSPPPQNELTPFHPRSPYGCAKVLAYWATVNHRESYGTHASNGILFNHESPRRGLNFVTRKVCRAAAKIVQRKQDVLYLGNPDAKRDWGFAGDYVEAMWLMLQQPEPGDYVVATGEAHSVRELCEVAFSYVGLDYRDWIKTDPKFFRPAEVDYLLGDASKAKRVLGWEPKMAFKQLIHTMVDAEL